MCIIDDGSESSNALPRAAFAVLNHQTRVDILLTLVASWDESGINDYALSFSELREGVDSRHSGRFNYHLQRLTDDLLVQIDGCYEFTDLGWRIARALTDTTDASPPDESFTVDGTCYQCGGQSLSGRYSHEWVWIRCSACDDYVADIPFPADGFTDQDSSAVAAACDRIRRRYTRLVGERVCPECFGGLDREVSKVTLGECTWIRFVFECTVCGYQTNPPLGRHLFDRSEVVAFYDRHGIDTEAKPYWTFGPAASDDYTTVISESPWRFRTVWPAPNAELVMVVDEEMTVTEVVERETTEHDVGYPD
ncbi:hypothetical protein [Haloarcula argentinensis]|uniref:Transcriptional regulator n=1 Tax=Haloarcula argentinensis TaxID=43776 RepID=A0A830FR45_HALAR|nr:hypothetical protein [Haloarcula argentinensis]GGM48924.1 transcriptional regulator [Haloarcula argentinensis]